MITEQYTSPDGLLNLIVERYEDGDTAIGLKDSASHTHADILAELSGLSGEKAVRQYIDEVLSDRQVLIISRIKGAVNAMWICDNDDPLSALKYKSDNEELEFRFRSGKHFIEDDEIKCLVNKGEDTGDLSALENPGAVEEIRLTTNNKGL